jgi:hypothetical protein
MSKELTQKIIEAGIVPTHAIKQLKAWKQLPEDTPEEEKQRVTQQQLMEFVRDIGSLLEERGELPELRETMFDIDSRFNELGQDCVVVVDMPVQNLVINTRVLIDKAACLIFKQDMYGEICARVANQVALKDGKVYEIIGVNMLYREEEIAYYRCSTQGVPDHAKMPELR